MKVIIPVAGVGSRLRPHTYTTAKVLMTVAGAPMIDYILTEVETLRPEKVIFVIGHLGDQIAEYVTKRFPLLPVEFRRQEVAEGLGHAVSIGLDENEKETLIILGDTLFEADLKTVVAGKFSSLGAKQVEDARRFGVILQKDGFVTELIEKPEVPPSQQVMVGIYWIKEGELLRKQLVDMMAKNERVRGEFQLTTALQRMISSGCKMNTFDVQGWFDCGTVETLLETNRHYLIQKSKSVELPVHSTDTVIKPPVSISPTAKVTDSIIGPFVSIGPGATICKSVIENSIVERDANVTNAVLANSVIGANTCVNGVTQQLNICEPAKPR